MSTKSSKTTGTSAKATTAAKKEVKTSAAATTDSKAAAKPAAKPAAKKTTTKKAAAKPAAKKTTRTKKKVEQVVETFFEISGDQIMAEDIVARIKAAYVAEGHRAGNIKTLRTYVNLEERRAYYVINDKPEDKFIEF